MTRRPLAAVLAAGVFAAACGDKSLPPSPPTKLGFAVQPTSAAAGDALNAVKVAVQDERGNTVTSVSAAVTIALSNALDATLAGTTTVFTIDGVAMFSDLSITRAGDDYRLVASARDLASATSSAFAIAAAVPAKLVYLTQPTSVGGGDPITPPLQVAVQDRFDNVVKTATGEISIGLPPPGAGVFPFGTLVATPSNGIATFSDVRFNRPIGEMRLSVGSAALGVEPVVSNTFAVTLRFAAISAGAQHTCAVTVTGRGFCWGAQPPALGDAAPTSSTIPWLISRTLTFSTIGAGHAHTCALATAGAAYCWGRGDSSQIGDGNTADRRVPTAVLGATTLSALSVGAYHSCARRTDGMVQCWGFNNRSQLGDGTATPRSAPVQVVGLAQSIAVDAGGQHTCGLVAGGAAYCWGANRYGEGGTGTASIDNPTPLAVTGGSSFAAISAGAHQGGGVAGGHSCALTSAGAAYCWGVDQFGQVGDGTFVTQRFQPTAVAGGLTVAAITTGSSHTCAITSGGDAYCWGDNLFGQLGDGTTTNRNLPTPVSGALKFAAISAGDHHTCGVTADGVAYCWGFGGGRLGDGTFQNRPTPTRVVQ